MAIAEPKLISYEDYLSDGETNWRYGTIDGVRVDMASPTTYHQRIVVPPPFDVTPELVVEVVSDSDRQRVLNAKLADFYAIGVSECWVVRSGPQTVEILPLSSGGTDGSVYGRGEVASSLAFKGFAVPVDDIFQE